MAVILVLYLWVPDNVDFRVTEEGHGPSGIKK
jgi:hypothetical protein